MIEVATPWVFDLAVAKEWLEIPHQVERQ